jgi:predicted transcriptional regulator
MIESSKKGVMITYITPYKNSVNLKEMAESFGMSLESVEALVAHLIMEGDVKG